MLHPQRLAILVLGCLVLWAGTGTGQDKDLQKYIDRAIAKGVAALKLLPTQANGYLHYPRFEVGMTALAAWTLLESDVPPGDPAVTKFAGALRQGAVEANLSYDISLLILFFDRLGDPGDEALIEALALRLLGGQGPWGGWGYFCPKAEQAEKERLLEHLGKTQEQRAKGELGPSKEKPAARKARKPTAELEKHVEAVERRPKANIFPGDNSNTQFAMLALWVARRHGVPVDEFLERVVRRFRASQQANGGWDYGYDYTNPKSVQQTRATMNCAGLLGLALGHGISRKKDDFNGQGRKPADLKKDPGVKAGLRLMGDIVSQANSEKDVKPLLKPGHFHYFLFSLERMAVVYNVKKIGDKDWYRWGAKILVDTQSPTGTWQGDPEHGQADTCFALLFLKRANVAEDLTFNLMGISADPVKLPSKLKKAPKKKPEADPFDDLPKLIPKDKKKSKSSGGGEKSSRLDFPGWRWENGWEAAVRCGPMPPGRAGRASAEFLIFDV